MRPYRTVLLGAALGALAWMIWLALPRLVDHSLERLRAEGVIRIGYAVEPPFAYVAGNGEVTGEAPEVARRIAARLGIPRVVWVQTGFAELIDGLDDGRYDAVAAGMFVTPARSARVLFSEPTFRVRQSLLVRRGNPHGLHSYEQIVAQDSLRIAVLSGAVEESLLLAMGLPESRLLRVPDASTGQAAVEAGIADGLALSSPTIRWMTRDPDAASRVELASPFEAPRVASARSLGYGAVAFRLSDRALRDAWNVALRDFVGSAEHRALVEPFGFGDDEMPGPVTTAELVRP